MKKIILIFIILASSKAISISYKPYDKDLYSWECVYWAISSVESNFNHLAIGTKGDSGIIQIMPEGSGGYLDEANRLLKKREYTDKDRFCPKKSREIWEVVMKYRNPEKSLKRAIKLHNPKATAIYSEKVMNKYNEFIKTINY